MPATQGGHLPPFPGSTPYKPVAATTRITLNPRADPDGAGCQIQDAYWPGVPRVESFSYTVKHGISPDTITITTAPQTNDIQPVRFGNFVFTDGFRTHVLRDCRFDRIDATHSTSEGTVYAIRLLDRRWRWRTKEGGLGGMDGHYNQVDRRGKLVPWSIRAPEELARLCLKEMGELNFVIDLPPGLIKAAGANLDRFLRLGENFPQTNTNPLALWDKTPPAEALLALAERYGCRVIYQPFTDRVLVWPVGKPYPSRVNSWVMLPAQPAFAPPSVPPQNPEGLYPGAVGGFIAGVAQAGGFGSAQQTTAFIQNSANEYPRLPDYPYEMSAPSIDDPEAPRETAVAGAPIRVQARLPLEPVGEEWDGSWLPIDQLSYAPRNSPSQPQIVEIAYTGAAPARVQGLVLNISWEPDGEASFHMTDVPNSLAQRWADLLAQWAANPAVSKFKITNPTTNTIRIEGPPGMVFNVGGGDEYTDNTIPASPYSFGISVVQEASEGGRGWSSCPPPMFPGVLATERLSFTESRRLAQSTVFKYYRVKLVDPATRQAPLILPAYGKVDRISQLIIQPTKAEQVVPSPRIAVGVDKGNPIIDPEGILNQGVLPEFYNGRSRDRKATVTGSVSRRIGHVYWFQPPDAPVVAGAPKPPVDLYNTCPCDRVWSDFEIQTTDTGDQVVIFGEYVYKMLNLDNDAGNLGLIEKPELTLETAVLVRDPETDAIRRYERRMPLDGGGGPTEWHIHDELQISVIGEYTNCSDAAAVPTVGNPDSPGIVGNDPPHPQQTTIVYNGPNVAGNVHGVTVTVHYPGGSVQVFAWTEPANLAAVQAEVVALLNAEANFTANFTATIGPNGVVITPNDPAMTFSVEATVHYSTGIPVDPAAFTTMTVPSNLPAAAGNGPPPKQNAPNTLKGWHFGKGDLEYVEPAGLALLLGHARKWRRVQGDSRQYVGYYAINPDGAIQMVSYTGGSGGPTTRATLNDEHSPYNPPYAARLFKELLPPNKAALLANLSEREWVNRMFPQAGSPVR